MYVETITNSFEYGKLLGYFISDGVLSSKRTNYFANTNLFIVEEVARLLAKFYRGHHVSVRRIRNQSWVVDGVEKCNPLYHVYCTGGKAGGNPKVIAHQNKWREDYLELGLDEKQSLSQIMGFGKEFKKGLIQGIYNGDGTITFGNYQTKDIQVSISYNFGIGHEMARQFVEILSEFGINAHIAMSKPGHRWKNKYSIVKVVKYEDVCLMIQLLDDVKYPEKFDKAYTILHEQFIHGFSKYVMISI